MSALAAILIISGTTGLVSYLATRRRSHITTITRSTQSDDPEK